MVAKVLSDGEFVDLWHAVGPHEISRRSGVGLRQVYRRRRHMEKQLGRQLYAPPEHQNSVRPHENPGRIEFPVINGEVLVGSDLHLWPGQRSTAHRAFLKFIRECKPSAVILNGDVMDFPQVSRHPPIGWESHPTVQQEIEYAQDCLHEFEQAAGRARKIWTLGNHDARFETRLAMAAKEYAKIKGVHLTDHFPLWEPCWSVWINDDVIIKHRFKGGIHAPWNNTMWAGKSIVTGHLHSQKSIPLSDANGTRYGVDSGCLADPASRAFLDYTEDGVKNWRSGFVLLTFIGGELLAPEFITVWDANRVQFRGQLIGVGDAQNTKRSASTPQVEARPRQRPRSARKPMVRRRGGARGMRAAKGR